MNAGIRCNCGNALELRDIASAVDASGKAMDAGWHSLKEIPSSLGASATIYWVELLGTCPKCSASKELAACVTTLATHVSLLAGLLKDVLPQDETLEHVQVSCRGIQAMTQRLSS